MAKYRDLDPFMEQRIYPNEVDPVFFQMNELGEAATFPPHFHDEIEILYVFRGKIAVTIYGEEYIVPKYNICFVPSMSIHSVRNFSEISEYNVCFLKPAYFAKENVNITAYTIPYIINDTDITEDYKKLKNLFFGDKSQFKQIALRSLGTYFVINMIKHASLNENEPYLPNDQKLAVIKDVTLFLKEHACEQIDISEICKKYGYSSSYLSRLFKKYTKTTMSKALNYYRCINAQKLLMTKDISIMEISEMCGYNNYSYFTKTYKECIGELPSTTKNAYIS